MTSPRRGRPRPRREKRLPGLLPTHRPYRCGVCGAEFNSRERLDEHERVEHRKP